MKIPKRQLVCECGGRLLATTLVRYDFSPYVGFEVILNGMDGLKCNKCGGETIPGEMVDQVLIYTVVEIAKQPRRLNSAEARYLRHSIEATQEGLATMMGIIRGTVAKWEAEGGEISVQHDFMLRVFALTKLIAKGILPSDYAKKIMAETFTSVKREPAEDVTIFDVNSADVARMRYA